VTVKAHAEGADPLGVTMAAQLPELAPGEVPGPLAPTPGRAGLPARSELAEHVSLVVALVVLVGPVAHSEGGRGPSAAAWLSVATIAALACTRPWQHLTSRWWLLAPVVALAAFYVVPATSGGRAASVAALAYGVACGLLLAVAAYARTPGRRAAVAGLLVAGGVAQFGWALVPWWGGRDPSRPMVGTYYWHNQLAVALLMPALLGAALAVAGRRPWRAAGWVAAPVCVAGVVLSTSRATGVALVVGWLAVLVVAVATATDRRAAVVRALVVTVAACALTFVLPGPPLFDTRVSPLSGASARAAAGESVDANTIYRTQFWREAVSVTAHSPWTGAGYGRMAQVSAPLTPTAWAHSPLAHSGPLQAFADGGLPLGISVLAALALLAAALARVLWRGLRSAVAPRRGAAASDGALDAASRDSRGAERADAALTMAAAVAGLALLAHSLVDVDWSYPALAAQFAVAVGLALSTAPARGRVSTVRTASTARTVRTASSASSVSAVDSGGSRARSRDLVAATGSAVLVLVLAIGGAAAWGQQFHISAPQTATGKVQK